VHDVNDRSDRLCHPEPAKDLPSDRYNSRNTRRGCEILRELRMIVGSGSLTDRIAAGFVS